LILAIIKLVKVLSIECEIHYDVLSQ